MCSFIYYKAGSSIPTGNSYGLRISLHIYLIDYTTHNYKQKVLHVNICRINFIIIIIIIIVLVALILSGGAVAMFHRV